METPDKEKPAKARGPRPRRRRWPLLAVTITAALALGTLGVHRLAGSRTYQLAGDLTDRVETREKVVALTFDDGPDEHISEIVGTLAGEHVRATFFVIGSQLEVHPEYGATLVAAGHQLGNHTYTHRRMVFVSPDTVAAEVERTNTLIRETGQEGDIPFRPPNGKKLLTLPLHLAEHRQRTVMWDVEPDSGARPTPAEIVTMVREQARPGSIILLHPWYPTGRNTREAITPLIEGLRADGYRFVTIAELLAR
ncbi:chitooligosaccharide deacetylase [Streptosporangium violaceochromogenes]|nr:chitooligosaccharide deacetylase [Streptosporangium violaceochromogenes]